MKNRAELYQNIKKFYKEEAKPLLEKYEKERKEDFQVIKVQRICLACVIIGIFGSVIMPALFILGFASAIALSIYYKFSKNERVKTEQRGKHSVTYLDIEADYEMSIKRVLMTKFLQLFEENLKWHKHDDIKSPTVYEDLLLDNLEIFTQTDIITFDDIIFGQDLEVPTDIIETRYGIDSKNTPKLLIGVLFVFFVIPAIILMLTTVAVFTENIILFLLPFLLIGLFIVTALTKFIHTNMISKKFAQNIILRFKIPKRIKAHTVIFEKEHVFNQKNKKEHFEKIILEDVIFEKRFNTYSTNQVEARYLLTTAFMKRFKELKTSFKANNIRAEFTSEELIIILQVDKDMFQMGNISKETSISTFLDMANEISSVLEVSKQLNLDSKTGL